MDGEAGREGNLMTIMTDRGDTLPFTGCPAGHCGYDRKYGHELGENTQHVMDEYR